MFNLIGLGEHAGSGVPDIIHAWKEVGLEDPVVEERFGNPDRTTLTLPLTSSQGTGLITTPFTGEGVSEGAETKVLQFSEMPRTKNEIQEHLGIKSDRYIRQRVIQPLLSDGRLARTIPEKPSSPKQKYIATKSELERAQAILDNNPVLQLSPGDLRREGRTVEDYLEAFEEAARKKYLEYYEDEV